MKCPKCDTKLEVYNTHYLRCPQSPTSCNYGVQTMRVAVALADSYLENAYNYISKTMSEGVGLETRIVELEAALKEACGIGDVWLQKWENMKVAQDRLTELAALADAKDEP